MGLAIKQSKSLCVSWLAMSLAQSLRSQRERLAVSAESRESRLGDSHQAMPAEGSHNESRPITSLRFLQPQPSASTSASEGVQTTARHQRHQTSAAAASKHSAGTISDGFAGAKGLPKQAQIEHATPSAGKPSLLKREPARVALSRPRTGPLTLGPNLQP